MKHKFVRYGRLKSVRQKGFKATGFHSPPARYGFYSFPFGFEESFLVSGLAYQKKVGLPMVTKHEISRWFNRTTGEMEIHEYDWEVRDIWSVKHTFEVKNSDLIWHHLEAFTRDKTTILAKSKDWVQTTVEVWKKAFNRCINKQRMEFAAEWKMCHLELRTEGCYSRDHFEVFFDLKVK